MEPLTLFSWGYWGWGTATDQLVKAVDAIEVSRGYRPALFVDIRISRSVRAPGFNGRAFEKAVGPSRYRWIEDLGNLAIQQGGPMQIKNPAAAEELLDIARSCADSRQRLLFFCSCEFPGVEGVNGCHRVTVSRLVLEAARRRKIPAQVVEWPGGDAQLDGLEALLSPQAFDKVFQGAKSIPLEQPVSLAEMAGMPWFSLVTLRRQGGDSDSFFRLLTGPARYKNGGWYLPIYEDIDPESSPEDIRQRVEELREEFGFVIRQSGC
jgi:hypothetical protein